MTMVESRDLGMEGTRRGRESTRKIFERGARSGQRNARLDSEGQKVWKGRVQDTNEMLERREKEHEEEEEREREREILPEKLICQ
jgi:hypothetical protein